MDTARGYAMKAKPGPGLDRDHMTFVIQVCWSLEYSSCYKYYVSSTIQ